MIKDEDIIAKIKKDYISGQTYSQIAEKYRCTTNEVQYLIQKNKWKRKDNRSKVLKNNKNAKGNKGGAAPKNNKNALKTGEYENIFSSFLSEEEQQIMESPALGTRDIISGEIKLNTIRERRMVERIDKLKEKNKDLTITKMQKNNDGNSTEAQNTLFLLNKLEDGLTRVQEAKRRLIDLLYKIECNDGAIVEKPNEVEYKKNSAILDSIGKQLMGGDTDE